MTGHYHCDEGIGEKFGLEVMQALNDKCSQWKIDENIDYSLYGTPLEATTEKFAKNLKRDLALLKELQIVHTSQILIISQYLYILMPLGSFVLKLNSKD